MGLNPQINVCLKHDCEKVVPEDITGVYDANDNTGGWGSPNISGSDVDLAEITITWPDGSSKTYDVTDQVPDNVSGSFKYDPIEEDFPDGEYCIKYLIKAQENETLATATINYEDASTNELDQYTVEVDTNGDGTLDTTIASYTTGSSDTLGNVYDALKNDINNNSSFSATNSFSSGTGTFIVTAPSGTGSSYNNNELEVQENGVSFQDTTFSGGQDGVDTKETNNICPYFLCHVRCCVEKMWEKLMDELCECNNEKFVDQTLMADGYFMTLKSAAGCEDSKKFNTMLKRLQRICDFNNCNCS